MLDNNSTVCLHTELATVQWSILSLLLTMGVNTNTNNQVNMENKLLRPPIQTLTFSVNTNTSVSVNTTPGV